MRRAVIVHHDDDMARGARWVGPLAPILLGSGYSVELVTPLLGHPIPTDVDVVVVLGSEESAYDDSLPWLAGELDDLRKAVDSGTPVLGICFGSQVLARVLGGS
ncbi:gamma-glutamyl-gamma-aminobutyrate hydrolase family protein, partial [Actinomadura adrarensis]